MSTIPPQTKLILHIGHHKTGSTSIQEAFATHRVAVKGKRVLYPAQISHNYLPKQFDSWIRTGVAEKSTPGRPGLADLSALLQARDFDYAVISSEMFEPAKPAEFDKVVRHFLLPHVDDHAVICYVRPHAARILSSYAEQVKVGLFEEGLPEFHQKMLGLGKLHYAPRLAEWSGIYGAHFVARPMVRDILQGGSVVEDFARLAFGPEAELTITEAAQANESLCLEDLVLVRLLQSHFRKQSRATRHAMGWALAIDLARSLRSRPGTKLELHRSLAEEIRRTYLEDARALDAGLLAEAPVMLRELDKAVDLARPDAQSMEPSEVFTADELRNLTVLGTLMGEMLQNEEGQWRSFLQRRRAANLHGADEAEAEVAVPRKRAAGARAGAKGAAGKGPKAGKALQAAKGPRAGKGGPAGKAAGAGKGPGAGKGLGAGKGPGKGGGARKRQAAAATEA